MGRGAFGLVYQAWDPVINRRVALKVMSTSVAGNPDLLQRFYREAQSAGSLLHPNIITIYDMGDEGGTPFIAMELVDGRTLEDFVARRTPLPLSLKLLYAVQACRAFDYAHKRGIIHRDIKPGNIMVNKEGTVKVVDFGIARVLETSKTQTGTLIGTFSYMAPEMFRGEHATERCDIWSFGVLCYELLSYQRPFSGKSPAALMQSICLQEPPLIGELVPDCPLDLQAAIHRMLRKTDAERFQTMEDVLLELDPIRQRMQAETVSGMIEQGAQLTEKGEFTQAHEVLRQVLQIDSTNLHARALSEIVNLELKRVAIQPKAQQHVVKGRSLLQEGKLQEAKAEAENALHLDSRFNPALELQEEIQKEVRRIRLVNDWLRDAKQHVIEGAPEEAESLLAQVQQADPSNRELPILLQQVADEKARRQKHSQFAEGWQQARLLWTRQQFQDCIDLLTNLQQEFPNEAEIPRLLETAREDQAEQNKQGKLAEARSLLAGRRYGDCIALLTKLHREFPNETEIPRLLDTAREDQTEQLKQDRLAEARTLLASRRYGDCISLLTKLHQEFPTEAEIPRLLDAAREDQTEQFKQDRLAEARTLLASRRYDDCFALLAKLEQEFPDDAEIPRLLDAAREDQAEQKKEGKLAEARALLAGRHYGDGITLLMQLQQEFPDEDEIARLLATARQDQAEQKKRDALTEARKLLASRHYRECIALLTELQREFSDEEEMGRLLATARQDQAERDKQQKLAEARKSLRARRYQEGISLLNALQEEFSGDSEIVRLRETAHRDWTEQNKREKLAEARKLLSAREYAACLTLLTTLQQELPQDDEVGRLLDTAREAQEEHDRKQKVAAAKDLLAAQRFADALALLDPLLVGAPGDSSVLKLRTLIQREQEKQAKSETLEREWKVLKKLASEKAYPEVIARAEDLLREFPGDADLTRLLEFARVQQSQAEGEQRLRAALDNVQALLRSDNFAEAAAAARLELESFPGNKDLTILLEQAQSRERKDRVRQLIEQRLRDIKVKINRGQLSEAKEMAREALQTLGPDTGVNQLLTAAEVEREAREKKKQQDEQLDTIRTLVQEGRIESAATALDKIIKSETFHALDPRLYKVADEIEAARKGGSTQTPAALTPSQPQSPAKEYAVFEGPPIAADDASAVEAQEVSQQQAPPPAAVPSSSHEEAAWQNESLRIVENQLATFIGPLAGVIVKKAASRTTDPDELYKMIATNLERETDRRAFMAGKSAVVSRIHKTQLPPEPEPLPAATPEGSAEAARSPAVTPEVIERAIGQLAYYIGPISRVLANRAAVRADTERAFYLLLAGHLDSKAERAGFLKDAGIRDS